MSEEDRTPKEVLTDKAHAQYMEIARLIDKYVPREQQLHLKLLHHFELREYLATHTDEQINNLHLFETVYLPKCIVYFKEGDPEPKYPLKQLCPWRDCPEYDTCWATKQKSPPTLVLPQVFGDPHEGWSDFRKWLYDQKKSTPVFEDPEVTRKYYENLELEYREKGLYP